MGVASLVEGCPGRIARLHRRAHGRPGRRLVGGKRGQGTCRLLGGSAGGLGLALKPRELQGELGAVALDHLHVGQAVGERLLVLGVLAAGHLDLGRQALGVLAKRRHLALQRPAAHAQIAVDRIQVAHLRVDRRALAGRLGSLGAGPLQLAHGLHDAHGSRLQGQLQLAGAPEGRPATLAQHHGRRVEALHGRRCRPVAPRQVASIERLLADALLQLLHGLLRRLDGTPALLELGGKRRLALLGRIPLLLKPPQIVHRQR